MDIVITYVDGNDPVWQADYEKFAGVPVLAKRFRDWGTLKYLLRGVEQYMPFVRKAHLVVSHVSQVPDWVDTDNVNVVLHKDIIPEDYLPTFNSTTIEMFLHRIPGLDERFIYFNDDMFPVSPCEESDFYRDGKAVIGMTRYIFAFGMYKKQCRNSDRLARHSAGVSKSPVFVRPQHICSPMLKSECEKAYENAEADILKSLSRLRKTWNYNQYFFLDYMYYHGTLTAAKISNKHFSTAVAGAEKISDFIRNPYRKFCCINDVQMTDEKFTNMRNMILDAFEYRLPVKSRFER